MSDYTDLKCIDNKEKSVQSFFEIRVIRERFAVFQSSQPISLTNPKAIKYHFFMGKTSGHTPNAGATGMIVIASGGLDVAVAMGGGPYYLKMTEVLLVRLKAELW